jgi:hypothetical protein
MSANGTQAEVLSLLFAPRWYYERRRCLVPMDFRKLKLIYFFTSVLCHIPVRLCL